MNQQIMDMVVARMAEEEGTSIAVIHHRIQDAINKAVSSDDLVIQREWKKIVCSDPNPSIQELIDYLIEQLQANNKKDLSDR